MQFQPNPILRADSYKMSHFRQYPEGAEYVSSYIEARGCDEGWKETVFLGVQYFIKEYLSTPINQADIDYADEFCTAHGVPFNREGWQYIFDTHSGYMPVKIEALPEGTVIELKNCLVQMVNTDPKVPWLTSFLETALLRAVWYPTTVATQSREIKKRIAGYLMETTGSVDGLEFMLHDFGARGVSSSESAGIGGFAHMVNFMGTDTMEGIEFARAFYGADMPAYSVEATEHSTVTSWSRDGELDMYRKMIRSNPGNGAITSIVSDSYDIYNACTNLYGEALHDDIVALGKRGGRLVVRPDSGDPTLVPIECVLILMEKFGYEVNDYGYRVLPDFIRVLQGDGINIDSITTILQTAGEDHGVAASNFVFGMGGALLQGVNRDTLKFAMKASAICINGEWRDVYKNPVHGGKTSKKGRLMVSRFDDDSDQGFTYTTHREVPNHSGNLLKTVYENGITTSVKDVTLDQIRERAAI